MGEQNIEQRDQTEMRTQAEQKKDAQVENRMRRHARKQSNNEKSHTR